MMNLGLKLAIPSAMVASLVFFGGAFEQRRSAASEAADPAGAATAPSAAAPSATSTPFSGLLESEELPKPDQSLPTPPPPAARAASLPGNLALPVDGPDPRPDLAATSFAADLVRVSAEADGVDRLWQAYRDRCGVRVSRQYDFGREWFSIWDRAAEPTMGTTGCADALERVRQAGEKVRRGLLRARAAGHQARGTEVGMLRWQGLQWPQLEEDNRPRPQPTDVVRRPRETPGNPER
jgi:hypothetical protein